MSDRPSSQGFDTAALLLGVFTLFTGITIWNALAYPIAGILDAATGIVCGVLGMKRTASGRGSRKKAAGLVCSTLACTS